MIVKVIGIFFEINMNIGIMIVIWELKGESVIMIIEVDNF